MVNCNKLSEFELARIIGLQEAEMLFRDIDIRMVKQLRRTNTGDFRRTPELSTTLRSLYRRQVFAKEVVKGRKFSFIYNLRYRLPE